MQWFIFVIFASMTPDGSDSYLFIEPTFETREECIGSITDPEAVPLYVQRLYLEYGYPVPIEGVQCIDFDSAKRILLISSGGIET